MHTRRTGGLEKTHMAEKRKCIYTEDQENKQNQKKEIEDGKYSVKAHL